MVKRNYQTTVKDEKKIAKAFASNQHVSTKYSTEIAREIKGKRLSKAEKFLQRIVEMKDHLPLKKYNKRVGHRKGKAKSGTKSGRYPIKAAEAFLNLLNSVKANADYKGLDTEKLVIRHAFASTGFKRLGNQPQGRIAGKRRKKKSSHLEIIAGEAK